MRKGKPRAFGLEASTSATVRARFNGGFLHLKRSSPKFTDFLLRLFDMLLQSEF